MLPSLRVLHLLVVVGWERHAYASVVMIVMQFATLLVSHEKPNIHRETSKTLKFLEDEGHAQATYYFCCRC
jgi:hypothetical protein